MSQAMNIEGRIKRELYVGKVRHWATWSGGGGTEVHVICGRESQGLTRLRFGNLKAFNQFRESIDVIADEMRIRRMANE